MQETRYVKVNKMEIPVLISDEKEALHAAKAAGRAVVGLWTPEKGWEEMDGAECVVLDLEAVSETFLERAARRHLGLPWHICETKRLLVREICGDDFDEIWENQVGHVFGSVEKLEAYTKHQYGFYGFGFWALKDKEAGGLVGVAGVTVPEEPAGPGVLLYQKELGRQEGNQKEDSVGRGLAELELGYHIFPSYRRRGYAEESCLAILKYAEEELEADRIFLRVSEKNEKSINLARKLGFCRIK